MYSMHNSRSSCSSIVSTEGRTDGWSMESKCDWVHIKLLESFEPLFWNVSWFCLQKPFSSSQSKIILMHLLYGNCKLNVLAYGKWNWIEFDEEIEIRPSEFWERSEWLHNTLPFQLVKIESVIQFGFVEIWYSWDCISNFSLSP